MSEEGLSNSERRMLGKMQADSVRQWSLNELLKSCSWSDQATVVTAGHGLSNKGLATINEVINKTWTLGAEGEVALTNGLLEDRLLKWLVTQPEGERGMRDLSNSSFEKHESGPGVGLLKGLGVTIQAGSLCLPEDFETVESVIATRFAFLEQLRDGCEELQLDTDLLNHFRGRKGLLVSTEATIRTWQITEEGCGISSGNLAEVEQIISITPELLANDAWKSAEFKPYDVSLESKTPITGKSHPMQALIERVRAVFLEMGFSEIEGNFVQSAGWNMDALFIPQDHPAREMQDTFYLDNPATFDIPSERLEQWKSIHEDGGDTGSIGWGGAYSTDISQKGLLRTHTTVNTIQHLAANPNAPCRIFSVGRVFRKESIDRTHLPEFHQIEGIIMEPGANLPMLVTMLKTFYAKMGYPEVRVRPAYFPYTEPSLEVEVKWRGKWLELGGAGIFRPEVTEPLGCSAPVCAWGMGLERLAMLVLDLDDIRQLYISDLEWLRTQPIL